MRLTYQHMKLKRMRLLFLPIIPKNTTCCTRKLHRSGRKQFPGVSLYRFYRNQSANDANRGIPTAKTSYVSIVVNLDVFKMEMSVPDTKHFFTDIRVGQTDIVDRILLLEDVIPPPLVSGYRNVKFYVSLSINNARMTKFVAEYHTCNPAVKMQISPINPGSP